MGVCYQSVLAGLCKPNHQELLDIEAEEVILKLEERLSSRWWRWRPVDALIKPGFRFFYPEAKAEFLEGVKKTHLLGGSSHLVSG